MAKKRKTIFEQLTERLKNELDLDVTHLGRTHAGYWQRTDGAWSWSGYLKGTSIEIGSMHTATELVKCEKLQSSDGDVQISIYPKRTTNDVA